MINYKDFNSVDYNKVVAGAFLEDSKLMGAALAGILQHTNGEIRKEENSNDWSFDYDLEFEEEVKENAIVIMGILEGYFSRIYKIEGEKLFVKPFLFYLECQMVVGEMVNDGKKMEYRGKDIKPIFLFFMDSVLRVLIHDTKGKVENATIEELSSDKAKLLFEKARKAGFITDNQKWNGSKELLAYFVVQASAYLNLGKGEFQQAIAPTRSISKTKISWKPFETFFGFTGLASAKIGYERESRLPLGYEKVDKLFEG